MPQLKRRDSRSKMTVGITVTGKELLPKMTSDDADVFFKKMEVLFGDALEAEKVLPFACEKAEVSLTITGPQLIRELNLKYRDTDAPTDVLSFPLWEESSDFVPPKDWKSIPLGDIVACTDKIAENAEECCRSFMEELVLVLSHGFLHLIGYDHCDEATEKVMWAKQDSMVKRFFTMESD